MTQTVKAHETVKAQETVTANETVKAALAKCNDLEVALLRATKPARYADGSMAHMTDAELAEFKTTPEYAAILQATSAHYKLKFDYDHACMELHQALRAHCENL